jgi:hypothetical protein
MEGHKEIITFELYENNQKPGFLCVFIQLSLNKNCYVRFLKPK